MSGAILDFIFNNIISGVYNGSKITFHPDGERVLIPQGNKLMIYNATRGETLTHFIEHENSITDVAVSFKDDFILTCDSKNVVILSQLNNMYLHYQKNFKKKITAMSFIPERNGFCISLNHKINFYRYPTKISALKPFVKLDKGLYNTVKSSVLIKYPQHFDNINSITFSKDGKVFATCSDDMYIGIGFVDYECFGDDDEVTEPIKLTGHRGKPLFAVFDEDITNGYQLTTLGSDGSLFVWDIKDETPVLVSKRRLDEDSYENPQNKYQNILHAAYNGVSLVTGYSNGSFKTYAVESNVSDIRHNYHVTFSTEKVASLAISNRYACFTSEELGEIVIWDLHSGTVAQRNQSHFGGVTAFDYSPNGVIVATGGDDGKLKLWDTVNGVCLVTFEEHKSPVTDVVFGESGRTVVTSSYDGTCKAYDVVGARCFRTFETPGKVELTKVALDPHCEFVAACSKADFNIFLWSMKTGKLVESFTGHTEPISSLSFTNNVQLVTGSWDGTARIWDFLDTHSCQPYDAGGEVTDAKVSPDSKLLALTTSGGKILIYDINDTIIVGEMNISNDARGGKLFDSDRSARNTQWYFTTIDFSPDGQFVVCGGRTKFVCIYSVSSHILMRSIQHTHNREFSGIDEYIKDYHYSGKPEQVIRSEVEDKNIVVAAANKVRWCPTGRGIAIGTPEGLLIYTSADTLIVNPHELEVDVTPDSVKVALEKKEYVNALITCIKLGHTERSLLMDVLLSIPDDQIELSAHLFTEKYVPDFLQSLSEFLKDTQEVNLIMKWILSLLRFHTKHISKFSTIAPISHLLHKSIYTRIYPIKEIARNNLDMLKFLVNQPILEEEEDAKDT